MKELSDDNIFEYLMTSDFIENYRPDEWKFLLLKFRSFYKIVRGNKERIEQEKDFEIKQLRIQVENLTKNLEKEQIKSADIQNKLDFSEKKRKLTWKERFKGEIERFSKEI
jgi:putative sterol carrier protein